MLIRHHVTIMSTANHHIGFSHPVLNEQAQKRRDRAFAELITVAALFVSLAIAVTAVSIGIARADLQSPKAITTSVQ
jgi:hypothetical protein